MFGNLHRVAMVALLFGSAILLFSCKPKTVETEESLDAVKTEESHDLTLIMSENGRKSYLFVTPLLEGYMLGRDPYREFRKGISITTYQDDSLTTVNAVLVANYAIYYEKRKLWEAKGDVVITKHDGTKVYTQQLFWNSVTKRIYSNVDTKLVTDTDEVIGEGFESDEEMNEPRFRRWKGRIQVDMDQLREEQQSDNNAAEEDDDGLFPGEPGYKPKTEKKEEQKSESKSDNKAIVKSTPRTNPRPEPKPLAKPGQPQLPPQMQRGQKPTTQQSPRGNGAMLPQRPMRPVAPGAAPSQKTTK